MVVSIRHIKLIRICKQCVFARMQWFKNFWPRSDNEESMMKSQKIEQESIVKTSITESRKVL